MSVFDGVVFGFGCNNKHFGPRRKKPRTNQILFAKLIFRHKNSLFELVVKRLVMLSGFS